MMNQIQVILTIDIDNLPTNYAELLKEEQAVVAAWKAEGVLTQLYLLETKNGAILQFEGLTMEQVVNRIETLPFFQIKKDIQYLALIQQF